MKTIMTVTGPVLAENLGHTQCHEHLMITKGISYERNPSLLIDNIAKSSEEALRYITAGGKTIIDAQPGGCCRSEDALYQISRLTGLQIIASTGFHKLTFYPHSHWIQTINTEELSRFFIHELQQGMYKNIDTAFHPEPTPFQAGIIKTAINSEGLTTEYCRLFASAAAAAITTDIPIMVHIEQGSDPIELLNYLLAQGVPAHRIIFCHMDRSVEHISYYVRVLEKGAYLEFDTIGRFHYHSDEEEASLIYNLLDDGYEDQLLISLDTTRNRLKSYTLNGIGLDYILREFLYCLREYGITENQIHKLTHTNCIRLFTDT